jgi:hypothetical protein
LKKPPFGGTRLKLHPGTIVAENKLLNPANSVVVVVLDATKTPRVYLDIGK